MYWDGLYVICIIIVIHGVLQLCRFYGIRWQLFRSHKVIDPPLPLISLDPQKILRSKIDIKLTCAFRTVHSNGRKHSEHFPRFVTSNKFVPQIIPELVGNDEPPSTPGEENLSRGQVVFRGQIETATKCPFG